MNIFEEEVRKMAEEIARQGRDMDSASERSQIASEFSRDLVVLHWQPSTGREH